MPARALVEVSALRDRGDWQRHADRLVELSVGVRTLDGTRLGSSAQDLRQLTAEAYLPAATPGYRIRLHLDAPLQQRLARVDGQLVGDRLLKTAEQVLGARLDGYRGVFSLRWEQAGALDRPVVEALVVSSGRGAHTTPADVRAALEPAWHRGTYRNFGLRLPEPGLDLQHSVASRESLDKWQEASRELAAALEARIHNRITQAEFAERAHVAFEARAIAAPAQARAVHPRAVFDQLHVHIDRGAELLGAMRTAERQAFIESIVRDVAGVHAPKGTLTHAPSQSGSGLTVTVYFAPGEAARERAQAKLATNLLPALQARAVERGLDPAAAAALGVRFSARGFDKQGRELQPQRETLVPAAPAPAKVAPQAQAPATPKNWGDERLYGVHLTIRNVGELARMDIDRRNDILQRAVDRAWPCFEKAGIRGNYVPQFKGDELRLQIYVPASQLEARAVLQRPATQMRITNEIGRGLAIQPRPAHARELVRPGAPVIAHEPARVGAPVAPAAAVPRLSASVSLEQVPGGERAYVGVHRVEGAAQHLAACSSSDVERIVQAALRDTYQKGHPLSPAQQLDLTGAAIEIQGRDVVVRVPAGNSPEHWYERGQMAGPEVGERFADSLGQAIASRQGELAHEARLADQRFELARAGGLDQSGQRWTAHSVRLGDPQLVRGLAPEVQRDILQGAAARAFPDLGPRPAVQLGIEGRELVARVALPDGHAAARDLHRAESPRLLAESLYRDPRVPIHAAGLPPLERAGDVSIRLATQDFKFEDGRRAQVLNAVHRIQGGADYLARLSPAEQAEVLRTAIRATHTDARLPHRAGAPAIEHFYDLSARGRDIEILVPIGAPGQTTWSERQLMRSPASGRRFSDALSQAVARVQGRELLPRTPDVHARGRGLSLSRAIDAPLRVSQYARSLADSPVATLGHIAKNALLSKTMPAALQPLARGLARLLPNER